MSNSMQSHNKQHHYMSEIERLRRERIQRERENKEALQGLKEKYRRKKRSKTKSKRR